MLKKTLALLTLIFFAALASAQVPDQAKVIAGAERAVEKAAKLSPPNAPGCAVGVSLDGKSVFEKGFGMADLEYDIPITPKTIFESGSVAKQFTAASIVLLSLDGKLSLDDPVRKYIPELPDYGSPLTIRHLLNHTGGVRDWGSVMALTGVGRGDRVVSQVLAIDVIARQKSLDFVPGSEYSYSNSGYNLLAEIVERVSKQKFSAFLQDRLFKPLGMTNSSLRDDYQRIVPGRAQAYEGTLSGPWRLNMPFMNVYGNGGILTTVGDWLKWNAMLDSRSMGAPLVDALETVGVLNDRRKITYALGLFVDQLNGFRHVWHTGATAGYQALLSRYPDLKLSIAIMCNSTSRNGPLESDIFNEIMGPFPAPTPLETVEIKPEQLQRYSGLWRNERTHFAVRTAVANGQLRFGDATLKALRDGTFALGSQRFKFPVGSDGKVTSIERNIDGDVISYVAESPWTPTPEELNSITGKWYSDEADATVSIVVENGQAYLTQRPATRLPLRPQYKDAFNLGDQPGTIIWFTRAAGKLTMHVGTSRLRDMPFLRVQ
ncbi:MAG TPA: serine hydrolase domain-containing protein [Pyrinomonadaceae bacterium]|nr:serine hydrolase domain-containing protein [Pyrinomonadaceae bacterium]